MKILICDDHADECDVTKTKLDKRADVHTFAGDRLKQALLSLFQRVAEVLEGRDKPAETSFNGFDLAIVDNNLTDLNLAGARLTAETIIGYLRAFTDIPYIVSLNKNPHVDFDLRYLFGDYQSLADLALNTKHLANARLWGSNAGDGFAPWYWPQLADAADRRRKQFDFLLEHFDRPVWQALGFPAEAEPYLSRRAKASLSCGVGSIQEVTFRAFFDASRAMAPAEKCRLKEIQAASDLAKDAIRRITAYEVDRWIRREVLGPQDVLIDLPHLLAEMPFLLGKRAGQLDEWNSVVAATNPPFGLDGPLFDKHVRRTQFEQEIWAPGTCFWWPSLHANEGMTRLFFEANAQWLDVAFCEDVSQFDLAPETDVETVATTVIEFESEVAGSWPRRFIRQVDGYEYSPRCRIL